MAERTFGRGFDYSREDARMRGLVVASAGVTDIAAIERRFSCLPGDAWKVVEFRRVACLDLQRTFCEPGSLLTWRQAWRIATTWPFEPEIQQHALSGYGRKKKNLG